MIYENKFEELSEEGITVLMYYLFSEGFIEDETQDFTVEVIG